MRVERVLGATFLAAGLLAAGTAWAQGPEFGPEPRQETPEAAEPEADRPEETPIPAPPPREDPRLTAGGALRFFLASRHYRTLRELRSAMTTRLQARFDHDSTPFCGKRGIRIAAFDFAESDLKPIPVRPPKTAGVQPPPAGPPPYAATVRSLWEEQGETVELRTETVRLERGEDGLWRVADLQGKASEKLRFTEVVDGITTLRMLLRAWRKGDPEGAKPHLSGTFKARQEDGPVEAQALFGPDAGGRRHAAYQIVEIRPAPSGMIARVRLFYAPDDQPAPLEG
jgi:hypothetical protein